MLKPYRTRTLQKSVGTIRSTTARIRPARLSFPGMGPSPIGSTIACYCDSFFLLARMPLTISANDFSNMAAV